MGLTAFFRLNRAVWVRISMRTRRIHLYRESVLSSHANRSGARPRHDLPRGKPGLLVERSGSMEVEPRLAEG